MENELEIIRKEKKNTSLVQVNALRLLPRGFEEDLREAIQVVNTRAEGTLRPHSPAAEAEASQATLTDTTFPPNPRSTISNLVGLLAAIQSASETTSAIVQDIQQSVETSREARQAINDVVNVLCDQNQTTPPDYHRSSTPSPESVKTWTEEHPAGLYEPVPVSPHLPPVIVQLPEFIPITALGETMSSSIEELIAATEKEEVKAVPPPVVKCPFRAHILRELHPITKTKAVGK
ncbi:hypothetical protein BDR04DRAFT_1162869 [Suillus decipiens]|nr:hypothetical protein BDR04DRAFT_1162869 [Suillus decipiens]